MVFLLDLLMNVSFLDEKSISNDFSRSPMRYKYIWVKFRDLGDSGRCGWENMVNFDGQMYGEAPVLANGSKRLGHFFVTSNIQLPAFSINSLKKVLIHLSRTPLFITNLGFLFKRNSTISWHQTTILYPRFLGIHDLPPFVIVHAHHQYFNHANRHRRQTQIRSSRWRGLSIRRICILRYLSISEIIFTLTTLYCTRLTIQATRLPNTPSSNEHENSTPKNGGKITLPISMKSQKKTVHP